MENLKLKLALCNFSKYSCTFTIQSLFLLFQCCYFDNILVLWLYESLKMTGKITNCYKHRKDTKFTHEIDEKIICKIAKFLLNISYNLNIMKALYNFT